MAVTFTLSDGTTTLDLTDTSASIYLQEGFYAPVVATPTGDGSIPPYVTETLPVGLNATSYDGYATLMQSLATLQKRAAEYWVDQQQPTPVWLSCKLDGETTGRRALVKRIDFEFRAEGWTEWLYQECAGNAVPRNLFGTILVERHPYWERLIARTFPNTSLAAGASVTYDYTATADLVGDVPARVNALAFQRTAVGSDLGRFWVGVRSTAKWGAEAVTEFIPIWECEDGTNDDGEVADDGGGTEPNTASPGGGSGDYVQVTPAGGGTDWADGSFHLVMHITAANVGYGGGAINPEAMNGRFLWLLRAKTDAATTWEVQCYHGYVYSLVAGEVVEVTNTSWDYHEAGVWSTPPINRQIVPSTTAAYTLDTYASIWIQARQTSGAGNLYLDCICPVPVDEGFLKIFDSFADEATPVFVAEGPKDNAQVASLSTLSQDMSVFEIEHFRLPPGDGRLVIVYANSAASVLTDAVEMADPAIITSTYTERWTALRGAE
jgi:hypothetical protein